MARLLRDDGHEVEACTSSRGALEALARDTFDAVVTDLRPQSRGDDVVRAARESCPEACIIVATALDGVEGVLGKHACAIVSKPIDYDTVVQTVACCRAGRAHGGCYIQSLPEEPQLTQLRGR
jgi:DNA-binding NtrC family response regulator